MYEYEVKILNIVVADIEQKLKTIGAIKVGDFFYRSCSFDYPGFPLDKNMSWVRLRDEGEKVRLAYKKRLGVKSNSGDDEGMEEVEIDVDDFAKTKEFLLKIGLIVKFEQEKKRTRWTKDDVAFDLDTSPKLKTYLEIEGMSDLDVQKGMSWLGIDPKDAKKYSTTQVYELNGIRDKDYVKMTFDEFVKRT